MPFQKGHDPNRNTAGRPRGSYKKLTKSEMEQLDQLLGKACNEAMDVIFEVMRNKVLPPKERVSAAKFVVSTKIQVNQIIERRDKDPDGDDDFEPTPAPVVNLIWENKFDE